MSALELPSSTEDRDAGGHFVGQWRLTRIELVNWGTFVGNVSIDIARQGHLLTGASGSGKSSLLDAISAVMTPDRWLRLNAAAQEGGSRLSDRSLMSYVRGAWTKELDEHADRATTTFLRPRATWSGILLHYQNLRDEPVALGRVFHAPGTRTETSALKDARIFARGDLDLLSLQAHVEKGIDARRMTAAIPDALVTTSGKHGRFHERVVRQFGFRSDTTLQLLHKTQSAKNLGTLDALFRGFMLDQPSTFARADNAVEQFTELDRAHRHVVDLRRQAEALREVDATITAFDSATAETAAAARLYSAVEAYTATVKLTLAREALAPARAALARAEAALRDTLRRHEIAGDAVETANARVRDEGGARVELLTERIASAEREQEAIARERDRVAAELEHIGAPIPTDAAEFAELLALATSEPDRDTHPVAYELRDAASEARKAVVSLERQIQALRDHRSNLNPRLLRTRRVLAEMLAIPEGALPFAGELLSVEPTHSAWRGAIERVLAPLATTLLVSDERIGAVRRAAESQSFGVRLVIEAVPPLTPEPRRPRDPRSLVHRVAVADGAFTAYLQSRLANEYDYACVDHPDDLDAIDRGVTVGGLVKRSARRYEKDDRSPVGDPTRWVLGGDIEARLEELLARHRAAIAARDNAGRAEAEADERRQAALSRRRVLQSITALTWERIDLETASRLTHARRAELRTVTSASSSLRDAQEAAERAAADLKTAAEEHLEAVGAERLARDGLDRVHTDIEELEAVNVAPVDSDLEPVLDARFRAERRSLTLVTVDAVARNVQSALSRDKEIAVQRSADAARAFVGRAAAFRAAWPTTVADLTIEIDDRYGYRSILEGILARGLPEKEGEFRRLLRERSRDVVAHLLGDLRDAPALIRERILPVNASLGRSPFDRDDRFLEIDVKTARSGEVEDFLADLRRVVEGNWADESESGAEQRFGILERVIGRLGSRDRVDQDWRNRVLDTRLHVSFLAREKDISGKVTRVYDSSEGLSGGQRQKLVIFCLAAALRYQLTDEESDMPRFGSIVLDEAFDKADARYTRNAMDVFAAFGFHMVLATPQKLLQTLESYVGAITSVSNPGRDDSRLANVVFTDVDSRSGLEAGDGLEA